MAADVRERGSAEKGAVASDGDHVEKTPGEDGVRTQASVRSRVCGLLPKLLIIAAVPMVAFAVKYYQDGQLLKRHVSDTIKCILICSLLMYMMFQEYLSFVGNNSSTWAINKRPIRPM